MVASSFFLFFFFVSFSAGNKAELGANWIHGVLGNPLYELAVSKGLVRIFVKKMCWFLFVSLVID